jgi:hypothetical protein
VYTASIAVPEAFRYIFWATATTGDRRKEAVMDWARMLAYVRDTQTRRGGPLQCRERLGGLLHYYYQEAA